MRSGADDFQWVCRTTMEDGRVRAVTRDCLVFLDGPMEATSTAEGTCWPSVFGEGPRQMVQVSRLWSWLGDNLGAEGRFEVEAETCQTKRCDAATMRSGPCVKGRLEGCDAEGWSEPLHADWRQRCELDTGDRKGTTVVVDDDPFKTAKGRSKNAMRERKRWRRVGAEAYIVENERWAGSGVVHTRAGLGLGGLGGYGLGFWPEVLGFVVRLCASLQV